MMSFYGERNYKCKVCGKTNDIPFTENLCSECTYKKLVNKTNSLCEGCWNKCKQSALISIQHCPDYSPRKMSQLGIGEWPLDKPKHLIGPSSPDSSVKTSKKPKKTLKAIKRKK